MYNGSQKADKKMEELIQYLRENPFLDQDKKIFVENIIDQLTWYVINTLNFEKRYGSDSYEYAKKMKEERSKDKNRDIYKDNNIINAVFSASRSLMDRKKWERLELKKGYSAYLGAPDFIKKLIRFLERYRYLNEEKIVLSTSDALEVIASHQTGIPDIDRDNGRILREYNKQKKIDRAEFKRKKEEELAKHIEEGIRGLKDTELYINKAKKNRIGDDDNLHIGNKKSYTFKYIFDRLRYYAKDNRRAMIIDEEVEYKPESDTSTRDKSISIRINEIKEIINDLNKLEKIMNNELVKIYSFYGAEYERAELLKRDFSLKISSIQYGYENLVKMQKKYRGSIRRIDAILERKKVLDETLGVLNRSSNKNAYYNTSKLLFNEQNKCNEFLMQEKKEKIISSINEQIWEIEKILKDTSFLSLAFREIAIVADERKKTQEESEEKEREYRAQNAEAYRKVHEEEARRELMGEIKEEILGKLAKLGYKEDIRFIDTDTYDTIYSEEYKKAYAAMMIDALNKRGIPLRDGDLVFPYKDIIHSSEGRKK